MKKITNPLFVLLTCFGWALALLVFIMMLAGCSTTNKTKSVTKSHTDSSSVIKIDSNVVKAFDSATVKKDNTVTTTEKEDAYTKVTTVEFDTAKSFTDLLQQWSLLDSIFKTPAADYFPPQKVKKITITETGVKKEKQVIAANTYDSAHKTAAEKTDLKKTAETELNKTESAKGKDVFRIDATGLVIAGVILVLLILLFIYLKKRFPAIFGIRKKEKDPPKPLNQLT